MNFEHLVRSIISFGANKLKKKMIDSVCLSPSEANHWALRGSLAENNRLRASLESTAHNAMVVHNASIKNMERADSTLSLYNGVCQENVLLKNTVKKLMDMLGEENMEVDENIAVLGQTELESLRQFNFELQTSYSHCHAVLVDTQGKYAELCNNYMTLCDHMDGVQDAISKTKVMYESMANRCNAYETQINELRAELAEKDKLLRISEREVEMFRSKCSEYIEDFHNLLGTMNSTTDYCQKELAELAESQ